VAPRVSVGTGLSGFSLAVIAGGFIVAYAGLRNASVPDTLRALLAGKQPESRPSALGESRVQVARALASSAQGTLSDLTGGTTLQPGTTLGAAIAARARGYLGRPYVFGTAGPNTFDCSGLVTRCLVESGVTGLPSMRHTVTGQFYVWGGATTVPRPPAEGDLICWTGHIGIAVSATEMIHAPGIGRPVQVSKIYWTPAPLVRRVRDGSVKGAARKGP
jgi:cell wall-associated NlpC family hydrolase